MDRRTAQSLDRWLTTPPDKEELCQQCLDAFARQAHTCPYRIAEYKDNTTMCACCKACERKCESEIILS